MAVLKGRTGMVTSTTNPRQMMREEKKTRVMVSKKMINVMTMTTQIDNIMKEKALRRRAKTE